mmetsp:Transcript_2610/g.5213  ORF Transcript_2610/g.5213 Transcript_2610/m.5213 type:complete len:275 (+) Transcript_2610:2590-3414(+)
MRSSFSSGNFAMPSDEPDDRSSSRLINGSCARSASSIGTSTFAAALASSTSFPSSLPACAKSSVGRGPGELRGPVPTSVEPLLMYEGSSISAPEHSADEHSAAPSHSATCEANGSRPSAIAAASSSTSCAFTSSSIPFATATSPSCVGGLASLSTLAMEGLASASASSAFGLPRRSSTVNCSTTSSTASSPPKSMALNSSSDDGTTPSASAGLYLAAAAAATPRPVVVIVTEARTPIRLWLLTLLKLRTPCGLGRAARAPATRASERRASILLR